LLAFGQSANPLAAEQRRRIRQLEREAADQRARLADLYSRFGERIYELLQDGHPDPMSDKDVKFYLSRIKGSFEIIHVANETAEAIRQRSVMDESIRHAIRKEKEYITAAGNAPVITKSGSDDKRAFAPVTSPKPAGEPILSQERHEEFIRLSESMHDHDKALLVESLREFQSGDENAAAAAAHGLGRLSNPASVDLLQELARVGPEKVRVEAVDALAKIAGESTLPFFETIFKADESHRVRLATVRAHYQVGRGKNVQFILEAIHDPAPTVRRRSVTCLGWLRDSVAVPSLTQALTDSDPSVKRAAADALGHTGDSGALPALMHALDDSDSQLIPRVLKALENVTGENPPERLDGHGLVAFWKDWFDKTQTDKTRGKSASRKTKRRKKKKKKSPSAEPESANDAGSEPSTKETS
jgi:hypothetical protein